MRSIERRRWVLILLLAAFFSVVAPVSAQSDLAVLGAQMERAWNSANWPAALAILDHMRSLAPEEQALIDREQRGHLNYAWDLLAAGSCPEARAQLERALALHPGDPEALQGLALTRERCPIVSPDSLPTPVALPGAATRVLPTPVPLTSAPVDRATEYIVRRGDTLYSLARRFGVTVTDIQRASGLAGDAIRAGMSITIPPRSAAVGTRTYTVRAGDTLYSLAHTYGISVDDIRRANGLTGDAIVIGTELMIPSAGAGRTHTVQAGETLYALAGQYGTTVEAIQQANGLTGARILAGMVLVIP